MSELLSARSLDDGMEVSWIGPREYAIVAFQVLAQLSDEVPDVGVRPHADPLVTLEESAVADGVRAAAQAAAATARSSAGGLLLAWASGRPVVADADALWSLSTAANGAYVRLRARDLEAAGVEVELGVPGACDVDAALAEILGYAADSGSAEDSAPWSMLSALFATLSQEALELVGP